MSDDFARVAQDVAAAVGHAGPRAAGGNGGSKNTGNGATPPPRDVRAPRQTLVLLDTAEMLASEPAPIDWLVEGVVARGTLTMLAGREKEGKSMLCQALAATVAAGGGRVGGLDCRPGRVLIIDAENGRAVIHRRVRGLGLELGHAPQLRFVVTRGFDLRHGLAELERVVEAVEPDLLVLDSWRSLWGGKENDSDEVAACLDPVRSFGRDRNLGTILIHHMSRGRDGAAEYRGSTAAGASVENILTLARHRDDPNRQRRCLRNPGCRYEEEAPDRWLTVQADKRLGVLLVDEASPFLGGEDAPAPTGPAPVRDQLTPSVEAALTASPQRLADVCRAVGRDPKDQSVRRVLKGLADKGLATRSSDGWIRGCQVAAPLGPPDTLTPDTPSHYDDEWGDE